MARPHLNAPLRASLAPALRRGGALLATALLALVLGACATSPTGRSQLMLIPPQAAIADSRLAYVNTVAELRRENKLLYDPLLADRVEAIASRVVAQAVALYPHTARWSWSVALIDDHEPNAWCMAGGRLAYNSGLFSQLGLSNDEFAHIVGHEIAHAIANHTAEQMSVVLLTQAGLIAAAIAAEEDDQATLTAASIAAELAITLPHSRVAEAEADRIGMELAVRAGYDPAAAVSLWDKMNAFGGPRVPQFLNTHPAPASRRASLQALIPTLGRLPPASSATAHPVTMLP